MLLFLLLLPFRVFSFFFPFVTLLTCVGVVVVLVVVEFIDLFAEKMCSVLAPVRAANQVRGLSKKEGTTNKAVRGREGEV